MFNDTKSQDQGLENQDRYALERCEFHSSIWHGAY